MAKNHGGSNHGEETMVRNHGKETPVRQYCVETLEKNPRQRNFMRSHDEETLLKKAY
jgi:hypothetical protein